MLNSCSNMVINPNVSRFLGFGSSAFVFSFLAQRPSFQKLFGHWNLLKIAFYYIAIFMLFVNYPQQPFPWDFLVGSWKTQVGFLVLMLPSLYSYYEDRSKQGKTGEKGHLSMVGVVVLVFYYVVMSIRSYSQQRRRGGDEQHDIVMVGDSSHEKLPPILSSLPLTIHPSPSLSTPRRRPANLESSSLGIGSASKLEFSALLKVWRYYNFYRYRNTPSPILASHISFKTLNYVFLSATGYSDLLSPGRDFTRALPHLRFFNLPRRRRLQLIGPDDALDQYH